MSHVIYSNSFDGTSPIPDSSRDGPPFIAPSNIESSTFDYYSHYALQPFPPYLAGLTGTISGYQYDVVQNIEFPPLMGVPGQGPWSNEHPQGHRVDLAGPYSALDHPHNRALTPYTINVGYDGLTHPTTGLAEHREDQTHHGSHYMPVVPGSPRLEYHTPLAPLQDMNNDDPLDYVPLVDNVADPSRRNPGPVHSRMSDGEDEDLKRLASQYLNNPGSYVDDFRVRRHSGGRKVLIVLEIED